MYEKPSNSPAAVRFRATRLLIAGAGLLALAVSAAQAATYHVAPDGNDSNPGTASQPWRSISKANSALLAGDTVLIHAGTYTDPIDPIRDGTSDSNRITYQAFGDGDVSLKGFKLVGPLDSGAIDLGARKFITVSGRAPGDPANARRIRLVPDYDVGMLTEQCGAQGTIIENIHAECQDHTKNCDRGISMCLMYYPGNHASVNNIFRNSYIKGNVHYPSNGPNLETEDTGDISLYSHHNLIEGNIFEDAHHVVFNCVSQNVTTNVLRNNRILGFGHTGLSLYACGTDIDPRGSNFLIENNVLRGSADNPTPEEGPGNGFQMGSENNIVRYNTILKGGNGQHSAVGGFMAASDKSPRWGTNGVSRWTRIYNNTIVKNKGFAVGVMNFYQGDTEDLGKQRFVNNFVYDSVHNTLGRNLVQYWDNASGSYDGMIEDKWIRNVFGNPGGSSSQKIISSINCGLGTVSLSTAKQNCFNPIAPEFSDWEGFANLYDANLNTSTFADYSGNDFALRSSSPYIDAGAPLTKVASTDPGTGTTLRVEDARFFFGECKEFPAWMNIQCDWIAVGPDRNDVTTARKVQIVSADDNTTITLASSIARNAGDFVWLWKDSDGTVVVNGNAPDIGAFEFQGSGNASLLPPDNLHVVQ